MICIQGYTVSTEKKYQKLIQGDPRMMQPTSRNNKAKNLKKIYFLRNYKMCSK